MLEAYTMGGKIPYEEWYFEQRYSGQAAFSSTWDPASLDAGIACA
jgi:hypothetical protein